MVPASFMSHSCTVDTLYQYCSHAVLFEATAGVLFCLGPGQGRDAAPSRPKSRLRRLASKRACGRSQTPDDSSWGP